MHRREAAGSASAAVQGGPWQLHPRESSEVLLPAFVPAAPGADQVSPQNNFLLQTVVAVIRAET